MRRLIDGILLLDKPAGITSNGALQRLKRLYQAKKAGHTGSLDPIATGMLPLCFGEATKFSQFLLESDKTYYVVAKLGERTNTADREGEIIAKAATDAVTEQRILNLIPQFSGEIEQIPPMFSALKVQGKPLYELARQGIEIERQPRRIKIFSLAFDKLDLANDEMSFYVHCSKGTYIRTLIDDIGLALGCGAHVIELRRLSVTPYQTNKMYTLQELEHIEKNLGHDGLLACLLPVETAVRVFPEVTLTTSAAFYLRLGQPVRTALPLTSSLVRLVSEEAEFLGMGEVMTDGRVKPHRLLALPAKAALPSGVSHDL
jgi:tRNA pseudouridine55 synthase